MSNQIENQARQLRKEHEDLSAKKAEVITAYTKRFENPHLVNRVASEVATILGANMGTAIAIGVGPLLTKRTDGAINAYKANIEASAVHYSENKEAYHDMALQEDAKRGYQPNFDGAVATNVETVEVPVSQK